MKEETCVNEGYKLLIVEDDSGLNDGLNYSFTEDGYQVTAVATKKEAMKELKENSYDIVLLDCNLPDGSGFELCKEVRKFSDVLMLMLTARDTELDEITALELGVNDYMSKPFSLAVLKVRMKKLLQSVKKLNRIISKDILVDCDLCKVYKKGKEIPLSKQEYAMVRYFLENKNHVLTKEQILNRIWDSEGRFVEDNMVSVSISRIRNKIEDTPSKPVYIKTIHGIGYIWSE